jgi:catechol 2,3-dioxygenase-like lactoylglutathione lyase family enzyme
VPEASPRAACPGQLWKLPHALNHIGLTVPDIFSAIDWYGDVLGFTRVMGPMDHSRFGYLRVPDPAAAWVELALFMSWIQ